MLRRCVFAACLLLSLAVAGNADAYWGWGFGTNYYGYGLPSGWYTGVQGRMPPYFALHPPVYYSGQIVRIPYGASPFASPYGCSNAPVTASAPADSPAESETFENEFYKGKEEPEPEAGARSSRGQLIENPSYG